MTTDDESVGRSTYESLVKLTFLCGRGLEPAELVRRFLVAMRPSVPATGMWLYQGGRLVAEDSDDGLKAPPCPRPLPPGVLPRVDADGMIAAPVLPGMSIVCKLESGSVQRASDVVSLVAQVVAIAWQAELVSRDEAWDDDYLAAKATFKRRWVRALLIRHRGSVSVAARAAGVSRGSLYTMVDTAGARDLVGEGALVKRAEIEAELAVGKNPPPRPAAKST